jgi:dTDP-4-amino-4,6-dideoxygalactose transaminase
LILPCAPDWAIPVWHQYVVRHTYRDALIKSLAEQGIGSLIHYPIPPHLSTAYNKDRCWPALPIAEEIARTVISLPIGPHMNEDHALTVVDAIRRFSSVI